MSEHHSDCYMATPHEGAAWCICTNLRQAEQRVRDEIEADGPWFRSVVHQCCEDKQTAWNDALDAAREAVAACPRAGNSVYRGGLIEADTALAAIDALKGDPNG